MKKTYLIFLATLACLTVALTGSCDKLPKNGDLEGNWQLTEISAVGNDSPQPEAENVKQKKIFWIFQLDLLCIRFYNQAYYPVDTEMEVEDTQHAYNEFFGRFNHQSNTLDIPSLYVHDSRSTDQLLKEDSRLLESSGIVGNRETFRIEALDKDRMVLCSDAFRLTFRKF